MGLVFTLFYCQEILTQSIKYVRTIQIQHKSGAKKSIESFLFGKKSEEKVKPYALCRLGSDRLCVTDAVNGAVYLIDSQGIIQKKITKVKGIKIATPVSVCSDDGQNLYISDSTAGGVIQFDQHCIFKRIFILQPGSRITGIAFVNGIFYCVDTINHKILCFDREGQFKFAFGKRGIGKGEFNFPTHISADEDFLYITDAMNFRVQVFDHKGTFVRYFGNWGRGGGNFSKPKGIAVDKKKRIFVTDAMFDNVQVFDRQGRFLYFFGEPGQQKGEFWMPMGIMVDKDNTIWIADTYNNRVQVFQLLEEAS